MDFNKKIRLCLCSKDDHHSFNIIQYVSPPNGESYQFVCVVKHDVTFSFSNTIFNESKIIIVSIPTYSSGIVVENQNESH